ncbi:ABC transporter permease [Calidifontibacter terrae]
MSTAVRQEDPTDRVHVSQFAGDARVSVPRVLHSEWVKFRSLRSSWLTLGIALLIAIGLGSLFSHLRGQEISQHRGFDRGPLDPTLLSLRGVMLAQLVVGVLGVLFITAEYSTGMIRSTLTAAPSRVGLVASKSVVVAVVTFVSALVAAFVAFLLGQHLLNAYHLGASLSSPGALRAVFGAAIYLTLVALMGLGCGFIFRSTGGSIAVEFLLLLVLPLLGEQLPQSWADHINKYLPMNAGIQGMSTHAIPGSLSPWVGLGVLALWALAALVIGAVVIDRRDA